MTKHDPPTRQTAPSDTNDRAGVSSHQTRRKNDAMDAQTSLVKDPLCPICRQPLFGRAIWIKDTGNCHDTCIQELVQDEIAARTLAAADQAA